MSRHSAAVAGTRTTTTTVQTIDVEQKRNPTSPILEGQVQKKKNVCVRSTMIENRCVVGHIEKEA